MGDIVHHCKHCGASDVEDMGLVDGEDLFCFRCHGRGPSEEYVAQEEREQEEPDWTS